MLWMLLAGSLAFANSDVITLKKGQHAPFDGTLLSPEAAARLLATGESELAKCQANAVRQLAETESRLTLQFKNKEAELAACTLRATEYEKIYLEQIKYLEKRAVTPHWKQTALFTGGVVTGITIVVVSAWVIQETVK